MRKINGAQERTRTSTTMRSPAPEAGASTNSATWAICEAHVSGQASAVNAQFKPTALRALRVENFLAGNGGIGVQLIDDGNARPQLQLDHLLAAQSVESHDQGAQ